MPENSGKSGKSGSENVGEMAAECHEGYLPTYTREQHHAVGFWQRAEWEKSLPWLRCNNRYVIDKALFRMQMDSWESVVQYIHSYSVPDNWLFARFLTLP